MSKKDLKLFAIIFLVLIGRANAEIFYWNDANGRTHYSDRAQEGARSVRLKPLGYAYYRVKKVFDGDTVLLENRLKVRFLGINTPEVEGSRKEGEVGGKEAKQWLERLLSGKKIRLETDVDKKDKYGRTLAHLFTEDKLHINLELVRKGLAIVNIHPPNLKYTDSLIKAQQQAEAEKLGVWGYEEYAVTNIRSFPQGKRKGWKRLVGRVSGIRNSRRFSYLELAENFDARIERKNLLLFPELEQYIGKQIEIRGWASRRKQHYSVLIRHPSAILIHQ